MKYLGGGSLVSDLVKKINGLPLGLGLFYLNNLKDGPFQAEERRYYDKYAGEGSVLRLDYLQ